MLWSSMNHEEKMALVSSLQSKRTVLLTKKVSLPRTSTKKTKTVQMNFKSKELENLFHSLPDDIKKFINS